MITQKPSRMVNGVSARMAVEAAIIDACAVIVERDEINIQRFWMTLYDQGFEVVGRPRPPLDNDGPEHNHLTAVILPPGECPACDQHPGYQPQNDGGES